MDYCCYDNIQFLCQFCLSLKLNSCRDFCTVTNLQQLCLVNLAQSSLTYANIFVCAGSGQYGDVYEAVWKKYKLQVAIKTLRASISHRCLWLHGVVDEWLFLVERGMYGECKCVFVDAFRKHIVIQIPKINVVKGWSIIFTMCYSNSCCFDVQEMPQIFSALLNVT